MTEAGVETDNSLGLIRSELIERCSVLEEKIVNEEMRHSYAIKEAATSNILAGTEWEVVQRQSNSNRDSLDGLTYATLSFFVQKPPNRLSRMRPESETITIILTSEELVELRETLQDALNAIVQVKQAEEHS